MTLQINLANIFSIASALTKYDTLCSKCQHRSLTMTNKIYTSHFVAELYCQHCESFLLLPTSGWESPNAACVNCDSIITEEHLVNLHITQTTQSAPEAPTLEIRFVCCSKVCHDVLENLLSTAGERCQYCSQLCQHMCRRCASHYCSRRCQVADWPKHKAFCFASSG